MKAPLVEDSRYFCLMDVAACRGEKSDLFVGLACFCVTAVSSIININLKMEGYFES